MKKMLALGFVAVLLGLGAPVHAVEGVFEDTIRQAREAYDQSDFTRAQTLYQSLEQKGLASAELYYNLGNTAFKMGHVGQAIAYYRWALRRAPGDEDIYFNLEFARSLVKRPVEKTGLIGKVLLRTIRRFTGQQVALGALAMYILFCICLGGVILHARHRVYWQWAGSLTAILFLGAALWAAVRITTERQVRWGVVVGNQVEARNGPGEDYHVGFIVPQGREVRILGQDKTWRAIGLSPEGYKGWIQSDAVWEDQ